MKSVPTTFSEWHLALQKERLALEEVMTTRAAAEFAAEILEAEYAMMQLANRLGVYAGMQQLHEHIARGDAT